MRIYCLASISSISPLTTDYISPIPYDAEADELILHSDYDGPLEPLQTLPSDYRLTEICIGWKAFRKGPKKLYEMQIYQKNSRLLTFEMLRGFVTIIHLDKENGCFELRLATSRKCSYHSPHNIDLKINAFCVKNTTTRGIITPEEEIIYDNYVKQISDFWKLNSNITSDNLQAEVIREFGPIILPNTSTPKVLRQKLTDFEKAINLLCDPKTGCYKNIFANIYDPITKKSKVSRIYQQSESLLFVKETVWRANTPRTLLHEDKDKFRDCGSLQWENVFLNNKIDFAVFNFQNLRNIELKKVNFGKDLEFWFKLAKRINFFNVITLNLQECGIKILNDRFFEILPSDIAKLLLPNNDISFISKKISNLTHLYELDLSENKNLMDDGIPWEDLPSSIEDLNLENTDITTIPSAVKKFTNLRNLKVKSLKLNHIEWSAFKTKRSIFNLSFQGDGAEIGEVQLKNVNTDNLYISNLKFTKLDTSGSRITDLKLSNNYLEKFNMEEISFQCITFFEIINNGLKTFSWKYIPKHIRSIDFSHNELEDIAMEEEEIDFSRYPDLEYISFKGNRIKSLPKGFENLRLSLLDLSNNYFGNDETDLTEMLWNRIPKPPKFSNLSLYLSHNKIDSIPCCLRNIRISDLSVKNCNLKYICPYLHTNILKIGKHRMSINAFENPELKLSFIPNTIYQLPKADIKPIAGKQEAEKV